MPKLPPLPPEFRTIRADPDLTKDEKIDTVWELLARRGAAHSLFAHQASPKTSFISASPPNAPFIGQIGVKMANCE